MEESQLNKMFTSIFVKRFAIFFSSALLVIVVIVAYRMSRPGKSEVSNVDLGAPVVTRAAAPANVLIPEIGMADLPSYIAIPQHVVPAGPGRTEKFRLFTIEAQNQTFSPTTVIVRKGDTVHMVIHAVDRDYTFTQPDYGFDVPIPKGATKVVEFEASAPGIFTFFCRTCENKGMRGQLVVAE